jgi:hypothetical protein
MRGLQPKVVALFFFFFFFGWARPEFASLQGGPAQYHLAKLSQENYFYFLFELIFYLGYYERITKGEIWD